MHIPPQTSAVDHPPMTFATAAGHITQPSVDFAVAIVSAYVSHNPVSQADLPKFIQDVHRTVGALMFPVAAPEMPAQEPAVPLRKSVTPDFIICLEDGKKFKSLRRHLRTQYNLTPEQYREKWGLPKDYPMVAPNYSIRRSQLAKDNGLGKKS